MKNWRTSILGILGAGVLLASSKGWIDGDTANIVCMSANEPLSMRLRIIHNGHGGGGINDFAFGIEHSDVSG